MATLEETITEIKNDNSRMGDDLKDLATQLSALQDKATAGEQVAADELAPIAAQLHATADALHTLAAAPTPPADPPAPPAPVAADGGTPATAVPVPDPAPVAAEPPAPAPGA